MKVVVVGSGYVGLVTGACFSYLGNEVICVDNDQKKIATLKSGQLPIYEPGLEKIVKNSVKTKKLKFTASIKSALKGAEVVFICVNTPPKDDGSADLSYVENVSKEIAHSLTDYCLIVEKSTVPVQTGERVSDTIKKNHKKGCSFDVASNPEFLREGSAVEDFLKPDRVVLGVSSARAEKILRELYKPLKAKMVITDIKSAELIKHASNSFLATKISFINNVAKVCDAVGADVEEVARGMGLDPRIGKSFLNAGIGFGGFCFPKDLAAFHHMAKECGSDFPLLQEVLNINEGQKKFFLEKIEKVLWNLRGKTLGVLGLAFKGNTDDMRFAPSIDIINYLQNEGVNIKAFDPASMAKAKDSLKGITYEKNMYDVCVDADALLILTDWQEFLDLDWAKVKKKLNQPIVFDGRNMFQPKVMKKLGFDYYSIGRG